MAGCHNDLPFKYFMCETKNWFQETKVETSGIDGDPFILFYMTRVRSLLSVELVFKLWIGSKDPHSAAVEEDGSPLFYKSLPFPLGILPQSWSHYTVPAGMTVIQWVSDFSERVKQLQNISQAAASGGAKELKVGQAVLPRNSLYSEHTDGHRRLPVALM